MLIMGRACREVRQTMEESRSMRIVCRPSNDALPGGGGREQVKGLQDEGLVARGQRGDLGAVSKRVTATGSAAKF
jgi:hypothetical protein